MARHGVLLAALLVQTNPQAPVLRVSVLNAHVDRRADAREGIDHEANQGAVAQADDRRGVDGVEKLPRLGRIEHRRLAAPHDVARPAHGGGGISRHDLACHHPIEQMFQRGQAQLRGRRGSRAVQFLDVGGDVNALDVGKLRHALRGEPIEKLRRCPRISPARVRVPDLRREEFKEAIGSTGARRGDEGRGMSGGDGRELVHITSTSQQFRYQMSSHRPPTTVYEALYNHTSPDIGFYDALFAWREYRELLDRFRFLTHPEIP